MKLVEKVKHLTHLCNRPKEHNSEIADFTRIEAEWTYKTQNIKEYICNSL